MMRVALVIAGIGLLAALISAASPTTSPAARKSNKLPVHRALAAHPVPVVRYRLAAELPPAEIPLPMAKPPPEKDLLEANQPADTLPPPAPRLRRRDPCVRYGGHRIVTHGGRYWHCRYG